MNLKFPKAIAFAFGISCLFVGLSANAQINTNGCTTGGFGINSILYTNTTYGTPNPPGGPIDWFVGNGGRNVIDTSNKAAIRANLMNMALINPGYIVRMNGQMISKVDVVNSQKYKLLIDAVMARDNFGGTGATDTTAFAISSKNAQDPAVWGPGATNVLGKNDLIDVGAHMFREIDSTSTPKFNHLWFVGLINRAEPGGSAYMDFEFFVKKVTFTPYHFSSGGPDLGHTSFTFNTGGSWG